MSRPDLGTPERPLVISVVGSSVTYMAVPRSSREQGPFGELLPSVLAERGVTARVHHVSKWFGLIHQIKGRYEELRDQHADVVVIAFGMGEAQPGLVPTWLVDHLTTWRTGSRGIVRWYRRVIATRLWRVVRSLQRNLAKIDRSTTYRLGPKRFTAELRALVERLRTELHAHVLVLDLDPVGSRVLHWLPGQDARAARYNQLVEQVVSELDDREVELVRNSRTVPAGRVDEFLHDGFHRTPAAHELTASLLADHIMTWLDGTDGARTAEVDP